MLRFLHDYINDYDNAEVNFKLALEYESIGQTGSALSFYLRCAERATSDLLQYKALLKCALCFERQKCRDGTVKILLQKAIALLPRRPEAYFLLSRLGEHTNEWQDSYTIACLGLDVGDFTLSSLGVEVEYPGRYALLFQKGVAAWWVGHVDESREIMADLKMNYSMSSLYATAVDNNIKTIGWPYTVVEYRRNLLGKFKYKFNGIERIEKNCSQSCQDMFVLAVLNGKENGEYLEIGSAEPYKSNNTALLEANFGWRGVSVEINRSLVDEFNNSRRNRAVCADATKVDYAQLIKEAGLSTTIDYLQVDCEPPEITFEILTRMPFDTHKFAVITFEHDFYNNPTVKQKSRDFLKSKGYVLIVSDLAYNQTNSYEDWWVHPSLVSAETINHMQDTDGQVKFVRNYMFN